MSFDVGGTGPVLLSLPAWTPGAYEISNFARWVVNFSPRVGRPADSLGQARLRHLAASAGGSRSLSVRFDYIADTLDNAMAWARPDFALFNGTNLLLYPEGAGFDFPATVTVKTQPNWTVATAMKPAQAPRSYQESSYHDLVDMPFFVGRMDYDSMQVAGHWTRLATYPSRALPDEFAQAALERHRQDDSGRVGGVPGDAVEQLQRHDDLRSGIRRRQRAWSTRAPTWASTTRA